MSPSKDDLPNMISAIALNTDTGCNQQTGNIWMLNKKRDNNGAWTEPIKRVSSQPYIANSILNYEVEIDYLCPRQR